MSRAQPCSLTSNPVLPSLAILLTPQNAQDDSPAEVEMGKRGILWAPLQHGVWAQSTPSSSPSQRVMRLPCHLMYPIRVTISPDSRHHECRHPEGMIGQACIVTIRRPITQSGTRQAQQPSLRISPTSVLGHDHHLTIVTPHATIRGYGSPTVNVVGGMSFVRPCHTEWGPEHSKHPG